MEWISVKDRLPEDCQRVKIYVPLSSVFSGGKPNKIRHAVFRKGRIIPDGDRGPIHSEDQWGNNQRPFAWFGGQLLFGQEVSHWAPMDDPPKEG